MIMKKLLLVWAVCFPLFVAAQEQKVQTATPAATSKQEAAAAIEQQKEYGADVLTNPEVMPEFPGGESQLFAFLQKHLQYPSDARDQKISGTVYVSFVVDTDGRITDIRISRGVHPSLDREAMRIAAVMPAWRPGEVAGKPVKVKLNLPIRFVYR